MRAKVFLLFIIIATTFSQASASWWWRTFRRLTLEEKVGQLFMIGVACQAHGNPAIDRRWGQLVDQQHIETLIRDFHVGGVIFYKGTIEKQASLTNELQKTSKIPLLIGQDGERGLGVRLSDAIGYPKNATLGGVSDESLLYDFGKEIGRQCRAIGVHVNFAPVVDINSNPDNPIIGKRGRAFGADKQDVARKGWLVAKGLQDAGVIACAKHFPGHGDTTVDSHIDLPILTHSLEHLENEELYPFKALITSGVLGIMSAHLAVLALDPSGLPASASRPVLTDLLRKKLGFRGLIFTDAMSMNGMTKVFNPQEAALQAICAGNDILVCPLRIEASIKYVIQAVEDGRLDRRELDLHVTRILKMKQKLGLHANRFVDTENIVELVNLPYAKELQKMLEKGGRDVQERNISV